MAETSSTTVYKSSEKPFINLILCSSGKEQHVDQRLINSDITKAYDLIVDFLKQDRIHNKCKLTINPTDDNNLSDILEIFKQHTVDKLRNLYRDGFGILDNKKIEVNIVMDNLQQRPDLSSLRGFRVFIVTQNHVTEVGDSELDRRKLSVGGILTLALGPRDDRHNQPAPTNVSGSRRMPVSTTAFSEHETPDQTSLRYLPTPFESTPRVNPHPISSLPLPSLTRESNGR